MGQRKSLPLEGGAPRSESKIYMTAGGSHTSTTLAQRQLRLMRSKLSIIAMSWCDTATFDLIRSGLSRTTFPQGKANLRRPEHFYAIQPYTPSVTFGDTSPYTPGGKRFAGRGLKSEYKKRPAGICFVFLTEKCVGCITGRSFDLPVFAFRLLFCLPSPQWLPSWQPLFFLPESGR